MKNTPDSINVKITYKKDSKYLNNLIELIISFILESNDNVEKGINDCGETL